MSTEPERMDEPQDNHEETSPEPDEPRDDGGGWIERFIRWTLVAFVLVLAALLFLQEIAYFCFGVSTVATITSLRVEEKGFRDIDDQGRGGHPWYEHHVIYEYQDRDGVTHQGDEVSTSTSQKPFFERGQILPVQYLRHSPRTSRLSTSAEHKWNWKVLVLVLLIGGGVLALVVRLTRSEGLTSWATSTKGWMLPFGKRYRRAKLLRTPFPPGWEDIVQRNIGLYPRLTPMEQERLRSDLRIFIAEKHWEGCAGLTLTDEIKVTIAAQACILLLGMEHDYFGAVKTILVYPTSFRTETHSTDKSGVVQEHGPHLLGQAWQRGPVILAWDEVLAGGRNPEDGRNVVYHEFAHQLDFMGEMGRLQHHRPKQLRRWRKVMQTEFLRLVKAAAQGRATLLDKYGAQSEAEFFAVATECFFEQPVAMRDRHPRLYAILRDYYGQVAAARFDNAEQTEKPTQEKQAEEEKEHI